ncbi:MAG: rhomboid family intramembrane serine protease [Acetobacterium sp.]|uniref:rhomboid family intramembrane serine protease n=1 Tax=Acetobacterium sp. TaxID=1872094 RepID=UPI003242288F
MEKWIKRIDYNAPVTLTFALVALLVLFLSLITYDKSTYLLFSVYRSSLMDPLAYIRIFTHILGHADFQHLFGNFGYILLLGPMLEEKYGSKKMLIAILITAFVTGLIQIILFPHNPLLGASGIVFMMIVMSSFANFKKGFIPLTLILIACLYLGQEIYTGFVSSDNISQLTHIVGGVVGLILGFQFEKNDYF